MSLDGKLMESGRIALLEHLRRVMNLNSKNETLTYIGRLKSLDSEPEVSSTSIRGSHEYPQHRCIVFTRANLSLDRAEALLRKAGFFEDDPIADKKSGNVAGYCSFVLGTPGTRYKYMEFISEELSRVYEASERARVVPLTD